MLIHCVKRMTWERHFNPSHLHLFTLINWITIADLFSKGLKSKCYA